MQIPDFLKRVNKEVYVIRITTQALCSGLRQYCDHVDELLVSR